MLKDQKVMGRASIKVTCQVYIGTVKFSSLFKESSCNPAVTFSSFGSEGHGVQPPQGAPFFHFQLHLCFFVQSSLLSFKPNHVGVITLLRKEIKPAIYLSCYVFFYLSFPFFSLYVMGQDLQKS